MNNKSLKILLLSDASSFHTERFQKQLIAQGGDVLLASLEDGDLDSVTLAKKGNIKQLYYTKAIPELRQLIQTFKPDIVSAHFVSGYGHIAAKALNNDNIPLALNLWGSDILIVPYKSYFHKRKTIYALKRGEHVFADSHYLINEAKKIYSFDNSTVIPWGIERKFLSYKKNNLTLTTPLKIIVPRAHEEVYNNLFIVEALKEMIVSEEIIITFPSFGSLYESFNKETSKLVGDKINYYDRTDRESYLTLAAQHDIYLSASLSDSSPVSLIEAMALNLIPIALDIIGVSEWLSSKNGFLFQKNNHRSLSEIIHHIIESKNDYKEMRTANSIKVENEAIFEENIAMQLSIFNKLVEGRR